MTESSGLPKPSVREVADVSYDETDTSLKICTEDGLRARCYYTKSDHPEYTIYADGDRNYALAAFVTYIYNMTGDFPTVERVGSPMHDLTWDPT